MMFSISIILNRSGWKVSESKRQCTVLGDQRRWSLDFRSAFDVNIHTRLREKPWLGTTTYGSYKEDDWFLRSLVDVFFLVGDKKKKKMFFKG